jgi:hypothetical protein
VCVCECVRACVCMCMLTQLSGRIAQVVERPPLDREVRGLNPSHDTMALLLERHYEFP